MDIKDLIKDKAAFVETIKKAMEKKVMSKRMNMMKELSKDLLKKGE